MMISNFYQLTAELYLEIQCWSNQNYQSSNSMLQNNDFKALNHGSV